MPAKDKRTLLLKSRQITINVHPHWLRKTIKKNKQNPSISGLTENKKINTLHYSFMLH